MSGQSRPSRTGSSLWVVPVLCVLAGLGVSVATLAFDRAFDFDIIPRWMTGGPDAALNILSTIATSMVSLAALVLTITMVVVQLAMGQFSPRIVQTFLRDRPSQLAIGLFVATFAHAMVAMREVRFDDEGQVPGVAVIVAYLLVLASIAMLVLYVHHIGRSLRVSSLIELVGNDTRRLLDERYPELVVAVADDPDVIVAASSGVVISVDRERLVELASAADCVLHIVPAIGSLVASGSPLLRIEGNALRLDRDAATAALATGLERTLDHDVAYGFRMLVDMAERSLSDSPFLDPTTAVQAIDRLYDGLRQLAVRHMPDGRLRDDAGTVRLTMPEMDWDAFVHLAFDEIRLAGSASPQISRRLVAALNDLVEIAPRERRPVLERQLELLAAAVESEGRDPAATAFALSADTQGIGVAASKDRSADA